MGTKAAAARSGPSEPSITDLRENAQRLFKKDFTNASDFTILYPDKELEGERRSLPRDWWPRYCCAQVGKVYIDESPGTSFEFQEIVSGARARLQVSRAYNATCWSLSVRWEAPKGTKLHTPPDASARESCLKDSNWCPSDTYKVKSDFVISSIADIVGTLHELIFLSAAEQHGLVLVTGETNSAKSKITRGLLWKVLDRRKSATNRLHLVTYEDPIEEDFASNMPPKTGTHPPAPPFDLTQRCAPIDCGSLQEALAAALRQTPAAFYIGEIRTELELAQALEFGGTGHLVLATTHAGSLLEALTKLLRAAKWEALGSRAIHIPKILAVVHLRKMKVSAGTYPASGIVPALYRRTPSGIQELVSDGLASILPHFPTDPRGSRYGSLGRQFVGQQLLKKSMLADVHPELASLKEEMKFGILAQALQEDLYG